MTFFKFYTFLRLSESVSFENEIMKLGAIAVLQVGFCMTLANFSFFMVFAAYMVAAEYTGRSFSRAPSEVWSKRNERRASLRSKLTDSLLPAPKTYAHVICEAGLGQKVSDYRSHFIRESVSSILF